MNSTSPVQLPIQEISEAEARRCERVPPPDDPLGVPIAYFDAESKRLIWQTKNHGRKRYFCLPLPLTLPDGAAETAG
jgi:hypothetical protein